MEAKEKAEQLIKRFETLVVMWTGGVEVEKQNVKQCALICVDEILSVIDIYPRYQMSQSETETVDYWQSVKQELLNLK